MRTSSLVVYRTHPLRLFGILCLRWSGTLMFLAGCLVLGRDIVTWLTHGGRLDLAVTRLSDILPPLLNFIAPPKWDGLLQGIFEFSRTAPLSLTLLTLGWCLRQLAQSWLEVARKSAPADWTQEFGSGD